MKNFASNRSVFDLSHERKLSCDMGQLVPIMCEEVVPGDTFRTKTEMLVRLSPLLAPVYHRINAFTHFFFVPTRLLQTNWESFITGGADGLDATAIPTVTSGAGGKAAGTLWDYFGLPTGVNNLSVVAYPFRAYQLIYNEWYRDQSLQSKVAVSLGDGADVTTSLDLRTRNWEKDYFTSALPWSQRGAAVTLPLGTSAPVELNSVNAAGRMLKTDGTQQNTAEPLNKQNTALNSVIYGSTSSQNYKYDPNGTLIANLTNATAASINTIRQAFQTQRWLENNARSGARYIESVMAHFYGVRPEDYRVQRPEYLGGGRSPIIVSEVIQTSATVAGQTAQGNLAGHGFSAQASHEFTKSFTEHGYIIGILSIMPRTAYYQGAPRMWNRTSKLDFYWPEFAHLGEQGILQKEIYATGVSNDDNAIFGYAPRYEEYRQRESSFHGDFRGSLDYWHMGRKFAAAPALNTAFVTADPTKRIHAVTTANTCWVQILNQVQAIRPIPRAGTPGMIDHG